MTWKQKLKWWMMYHGGSTIVILPFVFVLLIGGFKDPVVVAVALLIGWLMIVAAETLIRKLCAAILGYDFFAWIWNDSWAARKYLEKQKKKQMKK